jgi:hypothetical protein
MRKQCLDLLDAIDWLLCYLVDKSVRKLEQLTNLSVFDVKNTAQVYHLRTLSIVYIQVMNFISFDKSNSISFSSSVQLSFVFYHFLIEIMISMTNVE